VTTITLGPFPCTRRLPQSRGARGTSPADLPKDTAAHFEFAINLRTARTLGIAIPPLLLARADAMIECADAACLKRVILTHPNTSAARQLFLRLRTRPHAAGTAVSCQLRTILVPHRKGPSFFGVKSRAHRIYS